MKRSGNYGANQKAARAAGEKFYLGGPCKKYPSHGRRRYTSSGLCVECARQYGQKVRAGVIQPATRQYAFNDTVYVEARERGDTHFHGRPCKTNPDHGTLRFTSNRGCVACITEHALARAKVSRAPAGMSREDRVLYRRMSDEQKLAVRQQYEESRSPEIPRDRPEVDPLLWFLVI